jgi:AI-2 transport protein TqsA
MEINPRERAQISWSLVRGLVAVASIMVVVAGLRAARGILVPVLVAVFISVACAPIVFGLRRRGVPIGLAVATVVFGILAAGLALTAFVGDALADFARRLPMYQDVLAARLTEAFMYLEALGVRLPETSSPDAINPAAPFNWVALLLNSVRGLLTSGLLILLTVVFILLEAAGFEEKLRRALRNPEATFVRFAAFATGVKQYLAIKVMVSLVTGTLVAVWVAVLGVSYPLLWGLLAFLLNFIPTFGSIIAGIPAVLLALVEAGLGQAALVFSGYLAINMVMGNFIEPRWAGRGVGLSPLAVFLSIIFWGWTFGPVGLLLAVPLTIVLKLACESSPQTRWLAVLLGPEHAPPPPLPALSRPATPVEAER